MKTFTIFIFIFSMNASILSQNEKVLYDNYLVTKIHITNDYYLIFLKKNNEIYTIHSDKKLSERNLSGTEIQKDNTYYFELIYVPPKFEPTNYGEIITSYGFSGFEIGKLCRAKNLVGLTIISTDNENKAKNKYYYCPQTEMDDEF